MTRRRQFSLEFKREAVALTKEPGVSASQVPEDEEVSRLTLKALGKGNQDRDRGEPLS